MSVADNVNLTRIAALTDTDRARGSGSAAVGLTRD